MAAGSRKKYALNLNETMAFPDADHMPIFPPHDGESWTLLLQLTANESLLRPVFAVQDATGTRFVVALYTPNALEDAKKFKIGHTLCITSMRPQQFLDGQFGFRIEDPGVIEVLPVSLKKLWEINAELRARSDRGDLDKCNGCGELGESACTSCKSRYCSRLCQRSDWPAHKKFCKTLKALHRWNVTDWG